MAKIIEAVKDKELIQKILIKSFQSGNINFIVGSGASMPAIKVAGDIEKQIQTLFEEDKELDAYKIIHRFLSDLQKANIPLINDSAAGKTKETLDNYILFIKVIEELLNQRKSNLLPKQANIFTSNYDLFFEKAIESLPSIKLNDGFTRNPNLSGKASFSSTNFFNSLFNTGNLYSYKVEIPTINLIKPHGSLSWKKDNSEIIFSTKEIEEPADLTALEDLKDFAEKFAVVLPQKGKFRETILDRTYYDLLRLYANELDKENTLLIAFGFSFHDEHIFDITCRALKNPTLKLIIFAYSDTTALDFQLRFNAYSNIDIIKPEGGSNIDFKEFNRLIQIFETDEES